MNITTDDILRLLHKGEHSTLEIKACRDSVPRSVWETYSAFANTRGGVILLGVTEHKGKPIESRFEITGVPDSYKVVTDFFNMLNNRQKVSRDILIDSDVRVVSIDGKDVIHINVPEADYHKKPVYINDDMRDGSFKRTHEGDRRLDREELAMMIRDSSDDIDAQILEHYGMGDIDDETLRGYRQVFDTANPGHTYKNLDNKEFLYKMGGYDYDRHKGTEGLTVAGLLMFGKGTPIEKRFPKFRMDYLDLIGVKPGGDLKWNDRLTYDGRWENNLYNFVIMTMRKLLFTLPSEGRIVGGARRDGGPLYDGVREAIINAVTYSDFQTDGVLRIDRRDKAIILRNPGTLRISAERIYQGDFTHARNRNIQKMWRMIGYGDNIGSGFQKILRAWETLNYSRPDLRELPDVQEVWLTLPLSENSQINPQAKQLVNKTENKRVNTSSASNSHIISHINSHKDLSVIQQKILIYMIENPSSTLEDIATCLNEKVESIRYQRRLMASIVKTEKKGSNKTGEWQLTFEKR